MSVVRFTAIIATPNQRASGAIAQFIDRMEQSGQQQVCAENDAFMVYVSPATKCIIDEARGIVVIGTLFSGDRRVTEVPVPPEGQTSEHLISDCWGGYVAICRLPTGAEVLRDPSGAVSCYFFQLAEARVFTSDAAAAIEAASLNPQLDWTVVQQALVYRDLRSTHSALVGIDELHPGNAIVISDAGPKIRPVWSPWMFTNASDEIREWDDAVRLVRDAVTRCVTAWGNCYDRVLAEVSGGLDSSIIAAVLSRSDRPPATMSFGPAPGDPDETPFARAVAATLHLSLTISHLDVAQINLRRSGARHLPRPCARLFTQAIDTPRQILARELGAQAIFSGGGGDNVFCNLQSALPAVDRLRRSGLRPSMFDTVADIASMTQTTIWQVLAQTVHRCWHPRSDDYWPRRPQYIASEVVESLSFPKGHPWIISPAGTLPGKRAHVMTLIGIQNHLEARATPDDVQIISPLLSQPVMEACLRVPTWLWCRGGNNRAVAREAFRKGLPAAVIDRRSKGAFDGFCANIIQTNHGLVREMLLEGSLARQGLLDIVEIERDLAKASVDGESGARLLGLLDTEAWVRSWEDRGR